jgi:lipoprotein-anchoring transpeptidase ErfK/SrfK
MPVTSALSLPRIAATLGAVAVATALQAAPAHANEPFWGSKVPMPPETSPAALRPGEWIWMPEAAPAGPMLVVVGLDIQMATVYRNGVAIGYAPVSTGRKGFVTPTGVFTTLQKDRHHHSSIYNSAPMPDTQRLTWGGISLHAGGLPGYPSSHGCIHLPSAFADKLFDASPLGMTVVISDKAARPGDVAHPMPIAPAGDSLTSTFAAPLTGDAESRWQPEASPAGPVSIVLSAADRRAIVLRNGIEIGRARVTLDQPAEPVGTHVFLYHGATGTSRAAWAAVSVPGHARKDDAAGDTAAVARFRFPEAFRAALSPLLAPGTTLLVTDAAVVPETTGQAVTVVTNRAQDM